MQAWLRAFVNAPAFLERYPCYAYILAKLEPVESRETMAMAVSCAGRAFRLHVNVDYLRKHPEYLRGIILHEVHHIVLGHLTAPKFQSPAHPDLMRTAMEMSANEFIEEPLPEGHVRWQDFRTFGVRGGQSTLQRYECLVRARQNGFIVSLPTVVCVCGTREEAATPSLWRVPWGGPWVLPSIPSQLARRFLRAILEEIPSSIRARHGSTESEVLQSHRLCGRDPADLIEELLDQEKPPETYLNWKTALRMFVARNRRRVYTLRYPSRRAPERLGQVPGRRRLLRPDGKPAILAAIDTSGSMGTRELGEIARQLIPLSRLARITVVECDATIHRVYPFKRTLVTVVGRGGTDFRPVFAREFLRKHRPDGVVYFTDGAGTFPEEPPAVRTLWVLTSPGGFACPWGERACLRLDTDAETV
jgi:predicted metal-dependent peptidase